MTSQISPGALDVIRTVHGLFTKKALTLSVAESCTGGLISHYITSLGGASIFFTAGIVSYSADIKKSLLGISPDTIDRYGMVSEETAREMAEKVRIIAKSDYSVSATGNLGPAVLEGKEKGLVHIAAGKEGNTQSKMLRLKGSREENNVEAAIAALRLLIEMVEADEENT